MAVQISQLFPATVLTAAAATIYTVPANPTTTTLSRGRIRFTNTSGATRAITAYAIQAGGAAGPANCFLNAETLTMNNHLDVDIPVLGAGGFIQAFADVTNDVTAFQLDGILFS